MNNNHACLVCLGSNVESETHIKNAHAALVRLFDEVHFGKSIRTKAEGGIQQPDYLNQAVRFRTELTPEEVTSLLKTIEKENGRKPTDKQKGLIPLDIDLLQYDQHILRYEDFSKDYVRQAIDALNSK